MIDNKISKSSTYLRKEGFVNQVGVIVVKLSRISFTDSEKTAYFFIHNEKE